MRTLVINADFYFSYLLNSPRKTHIIFLESPTSQRNRQQGNVLNMRGKVYNDLPHPRGQAPLPKPNPASYSASVWRLLFCAASLSIKFSFFYNTKVFAILSCHVCLFVSRASIFRQDLMKTQDAYKPIYLKIAFLKCEFVFDVSLILNNIIPGVASFFNQNET